MALHPADPRRDHPLRRLTSAVSDAAAALKGYVVDLLNGGSLSDAGT